METCVEVIVDRLSPGSMPIYYTDPDIPWYFIDEEGLHWKESRGERVHAPETELNGRNQKDCIRCLERAIVSFSLESGMTGTTVVAVRSFMGVRGPTGESVWTLTCAVLMTSCPVQVYPMNHEYSIPRFMIVSRERIQEIDNEDVVEKVHES